MHYLLTIFTRFGVKGLNLLTFLILAQILSINDFAKYGQVFTTSLLLSIFLDLGLRNSSAYFIGRSQESLCEIKKSIINYSIIVSIIFVIAVYFLTLRYQIGYTYIEIIPVVVICLSLFYIRTFQGLLLGLTEIGYVNKTDAMQKLLLFCGISILAFFSLSDLSLILWIFAFSSLLTTVLIIRKLRRLVNVRYPIGTSIEKKQLFIRGAIFMLAAFSMVAYKKVGFYVASIQGGEILSGIYFGIDRFSEICTEVGVAVSMVLFSKNVKNKSRENIVKDIAMVIRICVFVLLIITVLFFIMSKQILFYGLGEQFAEYSSLFKIGLFATFFGLVPTIIFPTLTILYHPIKVASLYFIALLFNFSLATYIYSYLQLTGIVVTLLISNVILTVIIVSYVHVKEEFRAFDILFINKSDFDTFKDLLARRVRKSD